MSTQTQASSANKISTYLTFIVLVVLGLSIVAMFSAAYAYLLGNELAATFLLIIGFFAMGLSAAVMFQTRRRVATLKIDVPKVMTTIECKACGVKTVREYQRGDYVFKELEECAKCPGTKTIVTAIYREVKEKEKTFAV
jgi:hypothetical protein